MKLIDGRQAKAARAILGMTVTEMAEAAGISRPAVLRVEHRKGLRVNFGSGGKGVDSLARAIEERGIILDVIEGQPIVRFATTAPHPKYQRRKPIEGAKA